MKIALLFLLVLLTGCMTTSQGNITYQPGPTLKVLSLNLCADYTSPRSERADKIIAFCQSEQVDIILAQEGVKGIGQFDMVRYIAGQLGYSYAQAPVFGFPGFFEFCTAVISRYPITSPQGVDCQVGGGDAIDKIPFPGASRGLLVQTGGVWVMSSHLTVPVEQVARENQVRCLLNALPPGVSVWAGDFNFTRANPAYPLIKLQEAVYSGNPQVDMIFYSGLTVLDCKLVFKDHIVSDHSGVLAEFRR